MEFSIGEFSRITGLSVKALRLYHEKGVLIPARVDLDTGYRYYNQQDIERARVVLRLRNFEFSLEDIREILDHCADEADLVQYLEEQRRSLERRMAVLREKMRALDQAIRQEKEAPMVAQTGSFDVEEKTVAPQLIAGVRMKGKYSDCGKGFALIGKRLGRHLCGKPLNLYYDGEYREDDADLEACIPVRKAVSAEGISVRELPGGRCVSLLHEGPYEELGRSYAKILAYVRGKGYKTVLPTREVYLKGPGMFLRGNPQKYLTEIQILIET